MCLFGTLIAARVITNLFGALGLDLCVIVITSAPIRLCDCAIGARNDEITIPWIIVYARPMYVSCASLVM